MAPPNRRPPPPAQLREGLAAGRRRGLTFDEAWDEAWSAVVWPHDTDHRRQWKEALRHARPEMAAAFANRPTRTQQTMRDFDPEVLYANRSPAVRDVEYAA